MVAHPASLEGGIAARWCEQAGHPGPGPEGGDVEGRPVGIGTLGAVAGDLAVHEAG